MTTISRLVAIIFCLLGSLLLGYMVAARHASGAEQAQSSPAALSVTVARPMSEIWPEELSASGWLEAWQEAVISAEVGQVRVTAVNADVGDSVAKGDVLAELSQERLKNDIAALQASVDSAEAALDKATADADRARQLKGSGSVSDQQIVEYLVDERKAKADLDSARAELASSKLDLERTRIVAVSDGVVSSRSAALGDVVSQGEEMFRLIRDNRIEWQAEVPANELEKIAVGTPAEISSPRGTVSGTVRQIAPSASSTNGRVIVYVELAPPKDAPQPTIDTMVSGVFRLGESAALSVPSTAIVVADGFSYVFVLDGEDSNKVTRVKVETGRRQDDRVELLGDFPSDAEVIQSGGAFLSEGVTVNVVDDETGTAGQETTQ
ncbi:efflux RND transporter periplasmic adaptor subunit [Martelella sp. AMO21009]